MKKLSAIFLIGIFLFNLLGYQFLSAYLQSKNSEAFRLNIEKNNFETSQLISIKVPTKMPYYSDTKKLEKVEGKVEVGGIEYHYVAKRFFNDSVEMFCLPNYGKQKLKAAKNEYANLVNDFQPSNKKSHSPSHQIVKQIVSEYFSEIVSLNLSNNNFDISANVYSAKYQLFFPSVFYSPQEQPPSSCA